MRTVIILRGLPGSGKSTFMALLQPCTVISMDLFWTRGGQEYEFDYKRLGEAVEWTNQQFIEALDAPITKTTTRIVVDNVSYARQHFQRFIDEAKKRECMIHVVHVERPINELSSKHKVPQDVILRQAESWEPYR